MISRHSHTLFYSTFKHIKANDKIESRKAKSGTVNFAKTKSFNGNKIHLKAARSQKGISEQQRCVNSMHKSPAVPSKQYCYNKIISNLAKVSLLHPQPVLVEVHHMANFALLSHPLLQQVSVLTTGPQ